jgi:hypothetical protein
VSNGILIGEALGSTDRGALKRLPCRRILEIFPRSFLRDFHLTIAPQADSQTPAGIFKRKACNVTARVCANRRSSFSTVVWKENLVNVGGRLFS